MFADRMSSPAWASVAFLLAIPCLSVAAGIFSVAVLELLPIVGVLAIFFGCAFRVYRLGKPKVADALYITGLFYLIACGAALSCSVLTITALPYADNALAAADRALGFDWLAMHAWFQHSPIWSRVLIQSYFALNWGPQVLIFLLCALRSREAAFGFLTAWAVALVLTVVIYPLFPAIAAFHHYGLTPDMMPGQTATASWQLPEIMEGLRNGTDRVLGRAELTGIVTMPSFHAAGAILLMWGYWTFKRLRVAAVALNGTMFLSAVPVGGHYLVDIIAGLALAVLAIVVSKAVHGHVAKEPAQPALALS